MTNKFLFFIIILLLTVIQNIKVEQDGEEEEQEDGIDLAETAEEEEDEDETDEIIPKKHSLFDNSVQNDRLSGEMVSIPRVKANVTSDFPDKKTYVAYKVTKHLQNMFLSMDPEDTGYVTEDAVTAAAEKYRWPKPAEKEMKVYIHEQVNIFGDEVYHHLNFEQFCKFMSSMFKVNTIKKIEYCNQGMTKAKLQLVNMFNLMDREKDGLLTRQDVRYGMSFFLQTDIDPYDVNEAFKLFGRIDGFMDEVGFLNSVLNDILTRKVQMDHVKKTYLDSPVA